MVDLSVKIGDLTLQNPVMPASGAFSWEYNDVIDLNRLGGLVSKTICREPRLGNPTPRMAETEAGIIQSIGLPGKEAAPHDHGIWCINASVSGREHHEFFRRTDAGTQPGHATVLKVGEVMVEPGNGMAMADHDIHATRVVGDRPAVGLALYGYALVRFPSVAWYHPQFGSMRTTPSRRHAAAPA